MGYLLQLLLIQITNITNSSIANNIDPYSGIINSIFKPFLELSALILGLVNGLMLLRNYLRDKPNLIVKPVFEENFTWFFSLPSEVYDGPDDAYKGSQTRKYGFLAYISVRNKGLRDVAINSWRLNIETKNKQSYEFRPITIPEPQIQLGSNVKIFSVFGLKGLVTNGGTMVKSGSSTAGFVYYIVQFYGAEYYDIINKNGVVEARFTVTSVFDDKASTLIKFRQIDLEKVKKMVKDIDKADVINESFEPIY